MIHTQMGTILIGYVCAFSALVMVFWLYPKWRKRVVAAETSATVFRCVQCGHVCFDLGNGAPVQCGSCGHWNEQKKP